MTFLKYLFLNFSIEMSTPLRFQKKKLGFHQININQFNFKIYKNRKLEL